MDQQNAGAVKALILTGGRSRRMGEEKYLLNIHGKPQYIHLHDMLSDMGIPVFLSCNRDQEAGIASSYQKIVDVHEAIGPMGGLESALAMDSKCSWLLIACDLVNLTPGVIEKLLAADDEEYDVITYQDEDSGFYETTITLYKPGTFSEIAQAVENGRYSLQGVLKNCHVKVINPADKSLLKNVNTREDLGRK